jgi:hypothetical protein
MTALDQSTKTICDLIDSCRDTQEGFLWAAEAAADGALKKLFGLYAQQRSRFAQELCPFAAVNRESAERAGCFLDGHGSTDEAGLLDDCLRREKSTLALYRKALEEGSLPTKARFLVAAQLALLERVHSRIESMEPMVKGPRAVSYPAATV